MKETLESFNDYLTTMRTRHEVGQPLVQGLQRSGTERQTADGWFRIHRHQQSGRWHFQKRAGSGWADISQSFVRCEHAEMASEQLALLDAIPDEER